MCQLGTQKNEKRDVAGRVRHVQRCRGEKWKDRFALSGLTAWKVVVEGSVSQAFGLYPTDGGVCTGGNGVWCSSEVKGKLGTEVLET